MNIFESNAAPVGQRTTESVHRKVELQAPADLTYLIAKLTQAAREKLEKQFPATAAAQKDATGEDADATAALMRKRVEELVDEYIRNTFDLAKDSISINGMDAREMEAELEKAQEGEEIEPFDAKLAQRILALTKQVDQETTHLANLRRKAPQETAKNFTKAFETQSEEYEAYRKADEEARLAAARATNVDIGEVQRADEMQGTLERGRSDLAALNRGLGGTIQKVEKAQKAVEVVEERR